MNSRLKFNVMVAALLTSIMVAANHVVVHAQSTSRQSISSINSPSGGAQGNGDSTLPSISSDGTYVAFASVATNLVSNQSGLSQQIYVRNRSSQETECVSTSASGSLGNDFSSFPSISADGRYVAFYSLSTNLVPNDTNAHADVFVYDRQSKQIERVSVSSSGAQGNGDSNDPSISANGRYVVYKSNASNLVAGDTNGTWDVFIYDRQTKQTERATVSSNGTQANDTSDFFRPVVSGDGRYVAFNSLASNLVAGDTNGTWDVFVRDRQNKTTARVSVSNSSSQANGESHWPSISSDGRFITFYSYASNLVSGDTNNTADVFLRDLTANTTEMVSVSSSAIQGNDASNDPSISDDGRFVVFKSLAANLVSGDTNATWDVYIRDRQANTTNRVGVSSQNIQSNDTCDNYGPKVSGDGRWVAYNSAASNLVTNDTNSSWDVFVGVVPATRLGIPHIVVDGTRIYLSVEIYKRGYGSISFSGGWKLDGNNKASVPPTTLNLASGHWQEGAELQLDTVLVGKHLFSFTEASPQQFTTASITGWFTGFRPAIHGWWFDNVRNVFTFSKDWHGECLGMTGTARGYFVANRSLPNLLSLRQIHTQILYAFASLNSLVLANDVPRLNREGSLNISIEDSISQKVDAEADGIMSHMSQLDPCDIGLIQLPELPGSSRHAVLAIMGFIGTQIYDAAVDQDIDELREFGIYDPNYNSITRHLYVSQTAGLNTLRWLPDGLDVYSYNTIMQITAIWTPPN